MIKRVAAGAFVSWAGIIGLAWWLAARRIEICGDAYYNKTCVIRATAARDSALIWGLSIGLAAAIIFALILARRHGWGSWRPSSDQIELRPVRPSDANSRPFLGNKRSALWMSVSFALFIVALGIWQGSRSYAAAEGANTISVDETLTTENVVAGPFDDLPPEATADETWRDAPLAQPAGNSSGQADTMVNE
jgi:hypothetical protein